MRLYLAYSFSQASPWPPGALGHLWVAVSADDIARVGVERALELFKSARPLPRSAVLVDSGGYRLISRGRLPQPGPVLEVQKALVDDLGDSVLPVLLDTPVRKPLRASEGDCAAANRETASRSRLWQRAFGDHYLYPIHACSPASLRDALELLRRVHPSVEAVGLGSLAPLAAKAPSRALRVVVEARSLIKDSSLHVFGAGNGLAALLSHAELADSADTASHIVDSRFGMARDPETMAMAVVAPRSGASSRPSKTPMEVASNCGCPTCTSNPRLLGEWGRQGLIARAVHNAYWILRALEDPGVARRLIWRRPVLAREAEALIDIEGNGK